MTKRLFLAVRLPETHVAAFASFMDRLRDRFPGAKWCAPETLHLTVRFFGDIDDGAVSVLTDALRGIMSSETVFPLVFDRVIFAPPRRPATMVWAIYADNGEFDRLARKIGDGLARIVVERVRHEETVPHVTLARFRHRVAVAALPSVGGLEPLIVSSCTLFESELTADGPIHRVLAEIPFGAAARTA